MTKAIIMSSILLVIAIIGLFGVIEENKWIVISTTVFSAIGVIAQFLTGNISLAIPSLAITVLIAIYAFMIVNTDTATYYYDSQQ
jgi:ABC-type Na+ efflux pump permease subunit